METALLGALPGRLILDSEALHVEATSAWHREDTGREAAALPGNVSRASLGHLNRTWKKQYQFAAPPTGSALGTCSDGGRQSWVSLGSGEQVKGRKVAPL